MNRTPATIVIETFGGVRATARKLKCGKSSVSRWNLPSERGGLDGRVPGTRHRTILALADGQITADQLIYGDKVKRPRA